MEAVHLMTIGAAAMAVGAGALALNKPNNDEERERFELHFPAEVSDAQVKAVLGGISGMRRASRVDLETIATAEQIRFYVTLERRDLAMLRGHLRGTLPGAKLEDAEPAETGATHLVRIDLSGRHPLLASGDAAESVASLLGVITELISGERLTYRWQLSPATAPRLPETKKKDAKTSVSREQIKALRGKYQGMLLTGTLTIEVGGRTEAGTLDLAHRIAGVLRSRMIYGQLVVRVDSGLDRAIAAITKRRPAIFSAAELTGIIGWPVGSPELPTLELGTAPQLMPAANIPAKGEGRRVGTSTWPGKEDRVLVQPPEGALSHTLILGPTGSGKSTLMVEMAVDDMRQNRGLVLIDMKGDTAEAVLARVPEQRTDDVIVLDPSAGLAVPGLKVLGGSDPELVADQLLSTFKGIFSDSWGVRSDQYLRLGFVTLANDPEATLADLGFLFTNEAYRSRLVGRIDDPMLRAAWASYEQLRPGEQAQHLASPLRKVNEVVARKIVRAVLAQPAPRFDMNEVLADGRIVVVSLSPGRLGGPAAALIGALVTYETYKAVLARQALPQTARKPFGLYIDEPKVLSQGSPLPLDSAFELFRGMGVGITLAAQSIGQLSRDLQKAALANAATMIVFRQGRTDAEVLARELSGVSAESLQHLPRFEAVARIATGHGQVARPATVKAPAPSQPVADSSAVRWVSAKRYGADPGEVDRLLRERHGITDSSDLEPVIGRQRRES